MSGVSLRRRVLAAAAVGSLVATFAGACGSSSPATLTAAKVSGGVTSLTLAAPAADALVDSSELPLRATATGQVSAVQASVGQHRIALHRRGTRWLADVPTASWLRPGLNTVSFEATGRDGRMRTAFRNVYARGARRDLGLRLANASSGGAEAVTLSFAGPVVFVRASVNGHDISSLVMAGMRRQTLPLGADDGLHPGKNTVSVTALTASGTYQTASLRLSTSRGAPVAAAAASSMPLMGRAGAVAAASSGPAVTARTGVAVTLDASASRPAKASDALHYTWRIISAPKGSHARLGNPHAMRPTFMPDMPGVYVVRLTLTERGAPPAADTVTVSAQNSSIPPIGQRLDTQYSSAAGSGVRLNGQIVAGAPATGQMVLVLLDRDTLDTIGSPIYGSGSASAVQRMVSAYTGAGDGPSGTGVVAILTSPSGVACVPAGTSCATENLLQALGIDSASSPHLWDQAVVQGKPFSFVTVTSGSASSVWRSSGVSSQATPALPVGPANLGGYLQATDGGVDPPSFVPDTHVPYDTAASSSATSNTIALGSCGANPPPGTSCQQLPSAALATCPSASPTGGFQVAVLWAQSLQTIANRTYTTNSGCGSGGVNGDGTAISAMSSLLSQYATSNGVNDYLVFVQSIGSPRPQTTSAAINADWAGLAGVVPQLGGTASVLAYLGFDSGYTLVGYSDTQLAGFGSPYGAETSGDVPQRVRKPSRLSGLLSRNRRNDLYPETQLVGGSASNYLGTITYQSPTPWPDSSASGDMHALTYITTTLAPSFSDQPVVVNAVNDGSCYHSDAPSIRAAYCDLSLNPNNVAADLAAAVPSFASVHQIPGQEFTRSDWTTVLTELSTEFKQVGDVERLIALLQAPLGGANVNASVDLRTAVDTVLAKVNPPASAAIASTTTWLGVAADIFGELWAVLPEPLSNVAGVYSETIALAGEFAGGPGNSADDLATQVRTTADSLSTDLAQRYVAASQNIQYLQDILVTDYGKLEAAVRAPGITPQTLNGAEDTLQSSSRAWALPLLLGTVYHPDKLYSGGARVDGSMPPSGPFTFYANNFGCYYFTGLLPFDPVSTYSFSTPFPSSENAQYLAWPANTYVLAGPGNPSVHYNSYSPSDAITPVQPPSTLLSQMFTPPQQPGDTTDLGVFKPHFFERTLGLSTGITASCPYWPAATGYGLAASSDGLGAKNVYYQSASRIHNDWQGLRTGQWQGPGELPGTIGRTSPLAAVSNGPGVNNLFFLGNGAINTDVHTVAKGWQGPTTLPGNPDGGSGIAAASASNGDIHVFYVSNGRLTNDWYTPSSGWQGPATLPGQPDGGTPLAALSAGPGDLHVFYRSNGKLVNDYISAAGGWQGPGPMPGGLDDGTGLAAASSAPGQMNVFFLSGGKLVNDYHTTAGWQGPGPLAGTPDGYQPLAAVSSGPDDLHVYFYSGGLLYSDTDTAGSGWQREGPLPLPVPTS